jgi:hypothetical protein
MRIAPITSAMKSVRRHRIGKALYPPFRAYPAPLTVWMSFCSPGASTFFLR